MEPSFQSRLTPWLNTCFFVSVRPATMISNASIFEVNGLNLFPALVFPHFANRKTLRKKCRTLTAKLMASFRLQHHGVPGENVFGFSFDMTSE
jgi:hypothetical protein